MTLQEKEMATHSSILAWRILWTEEPGGLLSMGLHRVGHDWSDFAGMHELENEIATHSSILAWRIPGTKEPGGLTSMGSHRVRHDWSNLAAATNSDFTMLCWFPLSSKAIYIYIERDRYSLFFGFLSHLGHYRALSRVPWATQQVLISYLFYTY